MRLQIDHLFIAQGSRVLIKSFSEQLASHEICALVGKNGSGKSTLLKTLAGLIKTNGGHIFLDENDLAKLSPEEKAGSISFLPQTLPTHPYCSAQSRIAHGLIPIFGYDFFIHEKELSLITQMAQKLNVAHLLEKPLSKLSGGEERLIHLAKCLINPQVKLLLLDEPSVFLDFCEQDNLISCLKNQAELGKTIIFSSHDQYFIDRLAHRVMKIDNFELKTHP